MRLDDLRAANIARQAEWDRDDKITPLYRSNELAGETGEACNVVKKLERERLGINGSRDTVEHLGEELADVLICVDLLAKEYGIDLTTALVKKFNATSEKMGLTTRLAPDASGLVAPRRPRVVIESPYAGDLEPNQGYLWAALRDCLHRGESPFASHGLYTLPGVLDDSDPADRAIGISAGFAFHEVADRIVVYTDLGVSRGMKEGVANAARLGKTVEYRTLPGWAAAPGGRSTCLASDECGVLCQERCTVQENTRLGYASAALQDAPGAMLRQLAGADPSQPGSVVLPELHTCSEPCLNGIDCDCACHAGAP